MKKYFKLIVLLFFISNSYSQSASDKVIDLRAVNAWTNENDEWSEYKIVPEILVYANFEGKLKVTNNSFLSDLCSKKIDFSGLDSYNSVELTLPEKTKTVTDKGVTSTTFKGKLVFYSNAGYYSANASVIFMVAFNNIVGLRFLVEGNTKEYVLDLRPKV